MKTISIIFLLFTFAAFAEKKPNILFIYTDDQSHRAVSCYEEAYDWVNTPNIDSLAKSGIRFNNAYIGTWCMPSRMTILTGLLQHGQNSLKMVGKYPGSTYDSKVLPFWPARLHVAVHFLTREAFLVSGQVTSHKNCQHNYGKKSILHR